MDGSPNTGPLAHPVLRQGVLFIWVLERSPHSMGLDSVISPYSPSLSSIRTTSGINVTVTIIAPQIDA